MALNFQQRTSTFVRRALLGALVVVSIVLLTVYAREGDDGFLHQVQGTVSGVVAPIEMAGGAVAQVGDDAATAVEDATADASTLSELREYNAQLIEQYAQGEEYRQEAERLRGLLDLKDAYKIDGVGARVIGRSTQAWSQTITIDKGAAAGVDSGQTVMGPTGVVGQVVGTTDNTATVRLLSDPQSGAAAIVQSSRAEGIVRGSLDGLLYLEDVAADAEVAVGDVVLTSGLGGSYTKGLLIGTVVKVSDASGGVTRQIVVSANDEASLLEEVLVVFSAKGSSIASSADEDANASDTGAGDGTGAGEGGDEAGQGGAEGGDETQVPDAATDSGAAAPDAGAESGTDGLADDSGTYGGVAA
ncbi:rod shape-determining protein MreC [Xiamenia xianingshaonis]|uniref:Cell shape-determining protein MreC n=1 Tax=Xiamenia xianingshaonis TaxID=2682776 RepID=A0A9E6MR15_9ACTN|nr:rod shape-determining protein MreC [Xiamenia xianingshaonis]NHM14331.1 rod shape-determining protein MreC [Xiamenia xianingshaonis]QTU84813.1 rod shape-determining protein MreC [Xiamenia xianingshaonis]